MDYDREIKEFREFSAKTSNTKLSNFPIIPYNYL